MQERRAWPRTTSADASTIAGHARRASRPWRTSPADRARAAAPSATARREVARGPRARRASDRRHERRPPPAAWTTARATAARAARRRSGRPAPPARRCAPRRPPAPAADVAHVAPVADAAVDVADDPPGSVRLRNATGSTPPRRPAATGGTPRPRATIVHRQAQQTVVSTPMPAAAARSAAPSTARMPSRNGPVPSARRRRRASPRRPRGRAQAHRLQLIAGSRSVRRSPYGRRQPAAVRARRPGGLPVVTAAPAGRRGAR